MGTVQLPPGSFPPIQPRRAFRGGRDAGPADRARGRGGRGGRGGRCGRGGRGNARARPRAPGEGSLKGRLPNPGLTRPKQTWFVSLMDLLHLRANDSPHESRPPCHLGTPHGSPVPHTSVAQLRLTVWNISSNHLKQRYFLRRLPSSQERQGDLRHEELIIPGSPGTTGGIDSRRSIRSLQL